MSEPSKRVQLRRIAADGHVHKFEGLLAKPLEVGERLVLWYGEQCKLTSTMIEKIIRERAQYTLQLMGFAADYYSYLTGAEERLECEYRCSGTRHHWKSPDEIPDIATLEEAFTKNLHAHLERDLAMKTTTCGPHRDDIVMSISGSSAHRYASQGQKRSIALSTKLAERDLLIEGDEPPILLVDDVTHEMDKHRCEKFFEKILTDAQVFLTFTEESSHRGLLDFANRWSVRAGKVEPLQP